MEHGREIVRHLIGFPFGRSAVKSPAWRGTTLNHKGNPMLTTNTASTSEAITRPETFRLPRAGTRDPFFGLPRTAFYELEKAGAIRLIRLKKRGHTRGTVLIPFDQMLAHVRKLSVEAAE
jgi:hypothetical protein